MCGRGFFLDASYRYIVNPLAYMLELTITWTRQT